MASEPCALNCGNPVNPHDIGVWKEVTGFVGGPKKDSMRLRTETGRHAHQQCVEKAQRGQAPDQPSLDEPVADTEPKRVRDEFYELFTEPAPVEPRPEPDFTMGTLSATNVREGEAGF